MICDILGIYFLHLAFLVLQDCSFWLTSYCWSIVLNHIFLGLVDHGSFHHFSKCLVRWGNLTSLEPFVSDQVNNTGSEIWFGLEHVSDEVFELGRKEVLLMLFFVLLPEKIDTVLVKILIVAVWLSSVNERRMTRIHSEQDHSKGENVSHMTLIRFLGQNFWCHIARCSHFRCV